MKSQKEKARKMLQLKKAKEIIAERKDNPQVSKSKERQNQLLEKMGVRIKKKH